MTDYKQVTYEYNKLRETFAGSEFTRKEISEPLKAIIPNGVFNNFSIVKRYGLVIALRNHKYTFPNKPVYWEIIKNCIDEMRASNKKYTDRYFNRKKQNSSKSLEDILKENKISHEELIKYLIDTGKYRILKRVEKWEEIE